MSVSVMCNVNCELWTEGNKRLDYAISLATVMSSIEGLPCVQHNNKNDLEASGSHSNVDSNKDENESSSNSNTKIENASILDTTMELQHWQHWRHSLLFNEDERSGQRCYGCVEPVFGPSYICNRCKDYLHHKSCAELPFGLHHPSHPNHPLTIFDPFTYSEEYDRFSKCDVCGEKSEEYSCCCYRYNFNIHIKCSSLALTIQTKVHDHQLTCIWKLMKFTCDFCGKKDNLRYCRAQCDFAIHSRCATCPRILKVHCHNHPLHLTPSLEVHQSDSPICLLCVRKVDTLCLYYCLRCDFVAHLHCAMLPYNREYINLQELKEEQSTESKTKDPELHQSFDSEICKVQ